MIEDYIPYSDGAFLEWAQTLLTHATAKTTAFQTTQNPNRGKPAGVHGTEFCRAFLAADLALVNDLTNSAFDTKSPHVFAFDEPEYGMALYICPHWENSKGEKGPLGEIARAIVP
jgi:hypothetical protein